MSERNGWWIEWNVDDSHHPHKIHTPSDWHWISDEDAKALLVPEDLPNNSARFPDGRVIWLPPTTDAPVPDGWTASAVGACELRPIPAETPVQVPLTAIVGRRLVGFDEPVAWWEFTCGDFRAIMGHQHYCITHLVDESTGMVTVRPEADQ